MIPTKYNLIVKPELDGEKITETGIVFKLAKTAKQNRKEFTSIGKVLAVGKAVNDGMVDVGINEGNYIQYFNEDVAEIDAHGELVHIVNVKAVRAVVK